MKKVLMGILGLFVMSSITLNGCATIEKVMDKNNVTASAGNLEELFEQDIEIRAMVSAATISFFEGAESFLTAAGNKESAEKFQKALEDLRENPKDPQAIKVAANSIAPTLDEIKQIEEKKMELSTDAKKQFATGVVLVGAGGVGDGLAGAKAGKLMVKVSDSLSEVQKHPVQHAEDIVKLKESYDLLTFISKTLPVQSVSIGQTVKGMIKFAQTNDITVSQEDINKKADELLKG